MARNGDHEGCRGVSERALSASRGWGASPPFISHLFLADEFPVWLSSWQHPNFAASEGWALTTPHWSIPAGVFFTEGLEARGVKVKVWHRATDLPTAEAFVARLLTLGNVVEPGGLWHDLYSEGTGGQRGWNKKNERNWQSWLEERIGMEEGEIVGGRRETKCSEIGQPVSHFSC